MNIICFGDSITHAAEFAERDRWPTVLQHKLDVWRPDSFRVFNRGIGGNSTAQAFDRLETDVIPLLPGVLLVQFGFNDGNVRDWAVVPRVGVEEYKKNLTEFARIARESGGQCVLIVNHTIDEIDGDQGNGKRYHENIAPYEPALRETAATLGIALLDLPASMAQRRVNSAEFLAEDGLHLSAAGNHTYADMVFRSLQSTIVSD